MGHKNLKATKLCTEPSGGDGQSIGDSLETEAFFDFSSVALLGRTLFGLGSPLFIVQL
jgi:hypothetical protein